MPYLNVKDFGARGDGTKQVSASVGAGSHILTTTNAWFWFTDAGKVIVVDGAGEAGKKLVAKIRSVEAQNSINLDVPAITGVAETTFMTGTDDTEAIKSAIASLNSGVTLEFPSGIYFVLGEINTAGVNITGMPDIKPSYKSVYFESTFSGMQVHPLGNEVITDTGGVQPDFITAKKVTLKNNESAQVLVIPTQQGIGNFYHTLDETYMNPDGQRDSVYHFGYNINGSGGRINENEAALHFAIESHYQRGGAGSNPELELHIQSITKNGLIERLLSMNIDKITGAAMCFWQMTGMQFFPSAVQMGDSVAPYLILNENGSVIMRGPQTSLNIMSGTSGIMINPVNDGSGMTQILNQGYGAYPGIEVKSAMVFNCDKPFAGNQCMYTFNAVGNMGNEVLRVENNGQPLFTVYKGGSVRLWNIKAPAGKKVPLLIDENGFITAGT